MRAVLIATGSPLAGHTADHVPAVLRPLVDRPFLQHVVEYALAQGVRSIDWVLCQNAHLLEEFLGSGERWGAEFRFHLVRDPARPYRPLQTLRGAGCAAPLLLGHADRLSRFQLPVGADEVGPRPATLYGWHEVADPGFRWSGWGLLPAGACNGPSLAGCDEADLWARLTSSEFPAHRLDVGRPLSVRSPEDLLAASRAVLAGEFPGLLLGGRELSPGVRVSPQASIASCARLVPPVYIGPGCEVGARVQVGPNVTLGRDCVIDREAVLTRCAVLPGTYVAEWQELNEVVIDRSRVFPAGPDSQASFREGHAVACLSLQPGSSLRDVLSRAAGLALLGAAAPALGLTALALKLFRPGPVLHRTSAVRLPALDPSRPPPTFTRYSFAPASPGQQRGAGPTHLFLHFLPALVHVAQGNLRLVGLPPRTPDEVARLAPQWQALYTHGRAGIISERDLHPEVDSAEEAFALEGMQAVGGTVRRDFFLLARYLLRVFWKGRPPASRSTGSETSPREPATEPDALVWYAEGPVAPTAQGPHRAAPLDAPGVDAGWDSHVAVATHKEVAT